MHDFRLSVCDLFDLAGDGCQRLDAGIAGSPRLDPNVQCFQAFHQRALLRFDDCLELVCSRFEAIGLLESPHHGFARPLSQRHPVVGQAFPAGRWG